MAQKLVNRGRALQSGLVYKYEASLGCSSSSDSGGSLIPLVKSESYAREVSRFARIMFPEFFLKMSTKDLFEKCSESSSCPADSTVSNMSKGTDIGRNCKIDEGIKIWFIKEYGLLTF